MPWLGLRGGEWWGCDFAAVAAGEWGAGGDWRSLRGLQLWKPQRMITQSEMLLVGVHREQTSGKPMLSLWGEHKQAKGKGQRSSPSTPEVWGLGYSSNPTQSDLLCCLFFSFLVYSCLAASGCRVFPGAQLHFRGATCTPQGHHQLPGQLPSSCQPELRDQPGSLGGDHGQNEDSAQLQLQLNLNFFSQNLVISVAQDFMIRGRPTVLPVF